MEIAGARVLITHPIVSQIMGSTVVALEIAEYLQQRGADVRLYAAYVADPALQLFTERGIPTISGDDPALSLADVDLVWVHSQVLPLSFLRELESADVPRLPIFVFHHMSSLAAVADEFPWILGLEERLSSLSLFISPAALETNAAYFRQPPPFALFENLAPAAFGRLDYRPAAEPRRILIVSNHIPDELNRAVDRLSEQGIEVSRTGAGNVMYTLVTPELLAGFDLVIAIGKTVQYCLLAGVPVYVYDHFGGPGYLSDDTFETLAWRHFSARDSSRRSEEEIAEDLLRGYPAAVAYQQQHRQAFAERFALDEVAPRLLAGLRPREVEPIDSTTLRSYRAAQRFGARFYLMWGERDELRNQLGSMRDHADAVGEQRDQALSDAAALRSSWSFRIGNLLIRPVALIRDVVTRLRHRLR